MQYIYYVNIYIFSLSSETERVESESEGRKKKPEKKLVQILAHTFVTCRPVQLACVHNLFVLHDVCRLLSDSVIKLLLLTHRGAFM